MRIIKFIFLFVLVAGLTWYFLLKDYNYKVTFTTAQSPGIVYDHLLELKDGNNLIELIERTPFKSVNQKIISSDSIFSINWLLEKKNDSTTLVVVKIKDEESSFKQNLCAIFIKNDFVKKSISIVKDFRDVLIENAQNYKLSNVTKAVIPEQHCAYISLESKRDQKASTMTKNIYIVMYYIKDNNLELVGDPFLEITEWDIDNDIIKFDFCFPIKEQNTFPETNAVSFKKTTEKEALKVIFNGNYAVSNMAWYKLMDYAETNHIDIDLLPVEFYLNDPHTGGNDLEWEAEVYMPISH